MHQPIEFLLELFLIEQLAAGGAIDLSAQFGDAVLIAELLLRLARDQRAQHVVAKGEVGRRRDRPAGHDHDGADRDPECDRPEPHLAPGMRNRIDACRRLAYFAQSRLMARAAVARSVSGMLRRVRRGMLGGSVARNASRILARDLSLLRPATTETLSTATLPLPPQQGADLSGLWLIFRKSRAWIWGHFANFGKCFGNGPSTR